MRKTLANRLSKPKARTSATIDTWHNGAEAEIHRYATSLQKAAKSLVQTLEQVRSPQAAWDVCPIIWLYRQALELHLKALVGEGTNFLKSKTDPISLYCTHSLRWLAQIVCQVIKALGWESDFTCEGVSNLTEFSSLVNEIESLDAVSCAVHFAGAREQGSAAKTFQKINAAEFATRLDSLLELLDVTADALAATWDRQAAAVDGRVSGDFGPTIQ